MKYLAIIATLILILTCFLVIEYALKQETEIEQIVYEQTTKTNSKNEIGKEQYGDKLDLFQILEEHKKYTTEYETKNGEKYKIIGVVKIPKINVEHDIFSDTSETLLNMSINRYWGANPNEVGNMCIIGHNYNDSKFFANLNKMKLGDIVEITDAYGRTLEYTIYDKFVVDPYDTRCTSQLTNGQTEITLITCHDRGRTRLILKARTKEVTTDNILKNFINKVFE